MAESNRLPFGKPCGARVKGIAVPLQRRPVCRLHPRMIDLCSTLPKENDHSASARCIAFVIVGKVDMHAGCSREYSDRISPPASVRWTLSSGVYASCPPPGLLMKAEVVSVGVCQRGPGVHVVDPVTFVHSLSTMELMRLDSCHSICGNSL